MGLEEHWRKKKKKQRRGERRNECFEFASQASNKGERKTVKVQTETGYKIF